MQRIFQRFQAPLTYKPRYFFAHAEESKPKVCFYKVLNVAQDAKFEEIKTSYLKLAKKYHPDANPDQKYADKFKEISEAFKVLSNKAKREQYDILIGIGSTWKYDEEEAKFTNDSQYEELLKEVSTEKLRTDEQAFQYFDKKFFKSTSDNKKNIVDDSELDQANNVQKTQKEDIIEKAKEQIQFYPFASSSQYINNAGEATNQQQNTFMSLLIDFKTPILILILAAIGQGAYSGMNQKDSQKAKIQKSRVVTQGAGYRGNMTPVNIVLKSANNLEGTPYSKIQGDDHQSVGSSVVTHSKSRHLVVLNNLKKREEKWDGRFYLEHIPKYNVFSDKHSQNFQYVLMKQQKRNNETKETLGADIESEIFRNQVEFAPGRIRKKPDREGQAGASSQIPDEKNIKSSQSNQRPLAPYIAGGLPKGNIPKTNEQLKQNIKESFEGLKNSWETMDIPLHHRELFIQCCKSVPRERAAEFIHGELEDLRRGDSFVLNCMKAIKGREQCLFQIENETIDIENTNNENNNAFTEQVIHKCSEMINHLRMLSINAVECIVSWRNNLMEFMQPSSSSHQKEQQPMIMAYLYKEQNYLLKMRNDTASIRNSILKERFFFSTKQEYKIDPFILSLTDTSEPTDKLVQNVSKNIRKRIDTCLLILNEELQKVQEAEKFQLLNSKKPSYNRYTLKVQGVGAQQARKSSQNARPMPKPQSRGPVSSGGSAKKEPLSLNDISVASSQAQSNQQHQPDDNNVLKNQNTNGGSISNQLSAPQQKTNSQIYAGIKQQQGQKTVIAAPSRLPPSSKTPIDNSSTKPSIVQQPSLSKEEIKKKNDSETQKVEVQNDTKQHENNQHNEIVSNAQPQEIHKKHEDNQQNIAANNQQQQKQIVENIQRQDQTLHKTGEQQKEETIEIPEQDEDNLILFTDNYLKKIETDIKNSVLSDTNEIKKRMRLEHESGCIEFRKDKEVLGIAYFFNESSQSSRRITLMHISAITKSELERFLTLLISYVFQKDCCDEIRLCLYHNENAEGKLQVNKEIQTIFTAKGFKWKQVNNDKYTRQRTTILALRRPDDIPVTVSLRQYDHIEVQSLACIYNNNSQISSTTQGYFDMSINALSNISHVMQENKEFAKIFGESEKEQQKTMLQQINLLMRKNYSYPDMKREIFENKEKLEEALKLHLISHQGHSGITQDAQIFASISKLNLKWRAYSQCSLEGKLYLRMNAPEENENNFMIANRGDSKKPVFILPTDDQSSNIFVFEIEDENDFQEDFATKTKNVIKSLKDTKQISEDVFLPGFKSLNTSQTNISGDYSLSQSLSISTNYTQLLPTIQLSIPAVNKHIIKPPFIFGLVNSDIDDILEVPYYSVLVRKSDCVEG